MKKILALITTIGIGFGITYYYFGLNPTKDLISFDVPTPTLIPFEFTPENPPRDSLIGEIASPSGEILWISRVATQAASLGETRLIRQGESLITKNNSDATVVYPDTTELKLHANTQLDFIQTLKQNLVFVQKTGTVEYHRGDSVLSVKSLHLLADINSSKTTFTTDEVQKLIYIDVYAGSVALAFNNLNFNTITQEVSLGNRIIFNDKNRKMVLRKIPQVE